MSYCRWSSDNFRSDVYVYEHCGGGFITHVAGMRKMFPPIPDVAYRFVPGFGGKWSQDERRVVYPSRRHRVAARVVFWFVGHWHRLSMWSVGIIPNHPIGLPYDGESFSDDTAEACAERLIGLRALGYYVPQYAIDGLREEATEALAKDAP